MSLTVMGRVLSIATTVSDKHRHEVNEIIVTFSHSLSLSLSHTHTHTHTDKLVVRVQKVAHYLLNKLGGGKLLEAGDRVSVSHANDYNSLVTKCLVAQVALVFRGDEGPAFAIAFFGCLFAAVIPVAIDPPMTKDVSETHAQPLGQHSLFVLAAVSVVIVLLLCDCC